ncbi:MAG: polyribonucleotide nucleotidyltransferase [Nitrospinae bacterium CG11_big_fil_rev_8_21_14_0_20_56_8]|nr:MAG: polyribonucleotide nucleotidyltransferase [Nitrospinae bacterium CG11_big_fil_rev_8_21_14_0_20_56_8]
MEKVEIEIDGKTISIEAGDLARQAGGAVVIRQGDTMVLVAATMAKNPREGIDFFPLTVDYREKTFAAGRFPGGFFKREARPSDNETLTCRLIDRPHRPLFPDGFRNETQVICFVISHDQLNPADVIAITGASTALLISDIPFTTPLAGARIGRIDGKLIFNPNHTEIPKCDLNLVVAGTSDGIVMVEAGAQEVSEDEMMEALEFAHERIKKLIGIQVQLREKIGKPKLQVEPAAQNEEIKQKLDDLARAKMEAAMATAGKQDRSALIEEISNLLQTELNPEGCDTLKAEIRNLFHDLEKDVMRKMIVNQGKRVDGRGLADIRPISIQVGYLPRTHGSAIFTRGETQALVTTTLGTTVDEQRMDTLEYRGTKSFMLHYNFPPFCTGETKFIGSPGRREVGHGMLAERSLIPILPSKEAFPYTIRLVSDILESNGSSSMASVCGGSLALMDAGVPIKAAVAGIAMGLIQEDHHTAVLSDILGTEDHLGDMDFKVAGTEKGITALQMDIKIAGLSKEVMAKALQQAKEGRLHILKEMQNAISIPRADLSKYAPRIVLIKIPKDKIRDVIGPGGKVIREIIEKTGVTIDINDDGVVAIASSDEAASKAAIKYIENLVQEVEVGRIYLGKVKKIVDFGAFVEIFPGQDGLVHISQICDRRIRSVSDELQEGDEIKVKVIDVDSQGKVKLSRKEALKESSVATAETE